MKLSIHRACKILPGLVRRHVLGVGVVDRRTMPLMTYTESATVQLDPRRDYSLIDGDSIEHNVFETERARGETTATIPAGATAVGWTMLPVRSADITHNPATH